MKRPKRKSKETSITFRLDADERQAIEAAAAKADRTLSDYVRRVMVPIALGRARIFEDRAA